MSIQLLPYRNPKIDVLVTHENCEGMRLIPRLFLSQRTLGGAASLLMVVAAGWLASPGDAVAQRIGFRPQQSPVETLRHEPIFGVGPRTIWKNGFGLQAGIDRDKSQREESLALEYHALYGITANWSVTAQSRQVIDQFGAGETGLGDLLIRTKYRFYRDDVPGGVFHSAVMVGAEFPVGVAGLSSESTDVFAGLSAAFEGRRWLAFGTGRYRVNTKGTGDVNRGNVFLYDVALGLRPVKTGYYQPDLVLMAELNGQVFAEREVQGRSVDGSAGDRLLAGFGAWVTYRNWAFKPGVQFPVYSNVTGGNLEYRFVAAVEFHI
jgi:hypothetical protein